MATAIIDQVIVYDNKAGAWAQMHKDGQTLDLIRYHDTERDGILAALPEDLRQWVESHTGEPGRVLRAAQLLAENEATFGRIEPIYDAVGAYTFHGPTKHIANAKHNRCSCEDFRYKRQTCKHLYAAKRLYTAFKRKTATTSLWDLAQAAVEEHKHDAELEYLIIWEDATQTRNAALVRGQADTYAGERMQHAQTWLYLYLSGHTQSLLVATLRYGILTNEPRWDWTCRLDEYKAWVREMSK
jgi:hypothetical protein